MVERSLSMREVRGSIPRISIFFPIRKPRIINHLLPSKSTNLIFIFILFNFFFLRQSYLSVLIQVREFLFGRVYLWMNLKMFFYENDNGGCMPCLRENTVIERLKSLICELGIIPIWELCCLQVVVTLLAASLMVIQSLPTKHSTC